MAVVKPPVGGCECDGPPCACGNETIGVTLYEMDPDTSQNLTINDFDDSDPCNANHFVWYIESGTATFTGDDGDGVLRCGIGSTCQVELNVPASPTTQTINIELYCIHPSIDEATEDLFDNGVLCHSVEILVGSCTCDGAISFGSSLNMVQGQVTSWNLGRDSDSCPCTQYKCALDGSNASIHFGDTRCETNYECTGVCSPVLHCHESATIGYSTTLRVYCRLSESDPYVEIDNATITVIESQCTCSDEDISGNTSVEVGSYITISVTGKDPSNPCDGDEYTWRIELGASYVHLSASTGNSVRLYGDSESSTNGVRIALDCKGSEMDTHLVTVTGGLSCCEGARIGFVDPYMNKGNSQMLQVQNADCTASDYTWELYSLDVGGLNHERHALSTTVGLTTLLTVKDNYLCNYPLRARLKCQGIIVDQIWIGVNGFDKPSNVEFLNSKPCTSVRVLKTVDTEISPGSPLCSVICEQTIRVQACDGSIYDKVQKWAPGMDSFEDNGIFLTGTCASISSSYKLTRCQSWYDGFYSRRNMTCDQWAYSAQDEALIEGCCPDYIFQPGGNSGIEMTGSFFVYPNNFTCYGMTCTDPLHPTSHARDLTASTYCKSLTMGSGDAWNWWFTFPPANGRIITKKVLVFTISDNFLTQSKCDYYAYIKGRDNSWQTGSICIKGIGNDYPLNYKEFSYTSSTHWGDQNFIIEATGNYGWGPWRAHDCYMEVYYTMVLGD